MNKSWNGCLIFTFRSLLILYPKPEKEDKRVFLINIYSYLCTPVYSEFLVVWRWYKGLKVINVLVLFLCLLSSVAQGVAHFDSGRSELMV